MALEFVVWNKGPNSLFRGTDFEVFVYMFYKSKHGFRNFSVLLIINNYTS